MLKFNMFSKESQNFFTSLVMSTMREREKKNITRHDMIHHLMEARKGSLALILFQHRQKNNKTINYSILN